MVVFNFVFVLFFLFMLLFIMFVVVFFFKFFFLLLLITTKKKIINKKKINHCTTYTSSGRRVDNSHVDTKLSSTVLYGFENFHESI